MHMWELPTLAVGYIVQLLLIDSSDSIAHSFLWALYLTGLCNTATLNAYIVLSNNNDIKAKTKLATITGNGIEAVSGNPAYVEQLYDEMATKFETKLVDCLQYRGPWVMYEYLEELLYGTSSSTGSDSSSDITSSDAGSNTNINSGSNTVKYCSNNPNTSNNGSTSTTTTTTTTTTTCVPEKTALYLPEKGSWRILDIGCGSGLVGKVFESYVRHCATHGNKSNTYDNTTTIAPSSTTTTTTTMADSTTTSPTTTAIIENNNDNNNIKISNLKEIFTLSGGLMIGIDVSAKIADIARNTGKYNYVLHSDLTTALKCLDYHTNLSQDMGSRGTTTSTTMESAQDRSVLGLDMVIAADTFIYVGALGEVFSLVRNALCDECTPNTSSSATTATATTGSVCDNTALNSSNNTTATTVSTLPPSSTTLHTAQESVCSTCECSVYKRGGLFMFTTEDLDLSPMRIHHTSTTAIKSVAKVSGPDHNGTTVTCPDSCTNITNNNTNTSNVLNLDETDLDITGAVPGWGGQLLTSARFAHSNKYIEMLAQKYSFDIVGRKSIILRTEETVPLPGNLFILQKITKACKCNK